MSQPLERKLTPADVGRRLAVSARHAQRLRDFPWHDIGTGQRPVLRCSVEEYERWFADQKRVA